MKITIGALATVILLLGVPQALADDTKSGTAAEPSRTVVEHGWISTTGSIISIDDESFTLAPHDRPGTVLKVDTVGVVNPQEVFPGDQVAVVGEVAGPDGETDVAGVLMTNFSNRAGGIGQNATGSDQ